MGMITWWYGAGWRGQFRRISERLAATAEFFSIGQLFITLFAPFRQISAGRTNGSLAVQLRALFDQTISRVIGAIVRLMTIVAGVAVLVVQVVGEVLVLIVWLTLPLFPIAGLTLMAIGWVPTWT